MANLRRETVSYRQFKADPLLSEGLLAVQRPGGELEQSVADAFFRVAGIGSDIARKGRAEAEAAAIDAAGLQADLDVLAGRPGLGVRGGDLVDADGNARPFKTNDPVATELPPEARAFLNGVAGGESGGQYNVRFTPRGGVHFDDLSRHPRIFEQGPHGRSSAAGRYQFTASTWDAEGGGDFSPGNQDRRAWGLAQKRYAAMTGRDLLTDLKAEGLSTRIQSALTPTWQAFKGARGRHAATYRDSLTRFVGAGTAAPPATGAGTAGVDPSVQAPKVVPAATPGGTATAAPAGQGAAPGARTPVEIEATGGTWRPKQGTDRATRAYNARGVRTYLQALNLEIEQTTAQLAEKYRDDPAGMQAAMQDLKAEQLQNHVFDEIRADYELTFDRRAGSLVMAAQRDADRRAEEQNLAEFKSRTVELEDAINRQMTGLDAGDDAAVASLHASQRQLDDHYDAAVAHGLISADSAREAKRASRNVTAGAYYLAQARDMDAEEIGAFREKLKEDYAAGRLSGVTDHAGLDAALAKHAEAKVKEEQQALAAIHARRDIQVGRIEAGFDPDPAEMGRLRLDQNSAPGGAAVVAAAEKRVTIARNVRDLPLPEARAYAANLRAVLPKDATNEQIDNVAYAENRVAQLEKLAAESPVRYEVATGRVRLEAIDFAGDEAALATGLAARRAATAPIARKYGSKLEILMPAERELLTRMIAEQPAGLPKLARAMRSALGADAAVALSEISADAPALAHAAGVAIATGSDSFVEDIAAALSAKAQGLWKLKMPEPAKLARAGVAATLGGALAHLDGTRAAVLQTAALAFEREANLYGFDPAEVDEENTPAALAWNRAVNRALGGDPVTSTGGLADVNGAAIVVPAGMDPTLPQRLILRIDDEVLTRLPPIRSGNGVPVSAAQLRRARLLPAGDGVFRVALGDPLSFDPQFVVGDNGDFWTLDLRVLEKLVGPISGWRRGSQTGWRK